MIDATRLVDMVLLNGNEESGLWEVLAESDGLLDASRESRLVVLRSLISRLLVCGLITLYRLPLPYKESFDLSLEESQALLCGDASWEPEQSIRLITTDKGAAAYQSKDYEQLLVGLRDDTI